MKELNFSKPLHKGKWETASRYILPDGSATDRKPETMTQLLGNKLVYKDDPRIIFRGKLDTFQSELIYLMHQCRIHYHASGLLIDQLKELLLYTRQILKHEVLNTPLPDQNLLSWTYKEIRERSHNPAIYYGLEQMVLVDDEFFGAVLLLNVLRAKIREIEIYAIQAFKTEDTMLRNDLVTGLNRMSSCFHILMYQEIAHSLSKET